MKKISVITINYNNAAGLEKTVRSVVSQSYADFEYIIIDGGSKDGSKAIIEANRDKIAYWVSEKDKGIYNAMNKGIKAATGEFLLFLNSGDFLCDQNVLKKIMSYKPNEEIVYGNMLINWGNNKITKGRMPDKITLRHMYTDTLWHPVSFIKKSVFEQCGFYDETFRLVGDYDFFFRAIIVKQVSTRHLGVNVAEYNTQGISSNPAYKQIEMEERQRVIHTYLSPAEITTLQKTTGAGKNIFAGLLNFLKRQ